MSDYQYYQNMGNDGAPQQSQQAQSQQTQSQQEQSQQTQSQSTEAQSNDAMPPQDPWAQVEQPKDKNKEQGGSFIP